MINYILYINHNKCKVLTVNTRVLKSIETYSLGGSFKLLSQTINGLDTKLKYVKPAGQYSLYVQ